MQAEGAGPRDIADALAEYKAQRIANRRPEALVLGCDQVLVLKGRILGKPTDRNDARARLQELRGQQHSLLSAAVLFDGGRPIWRHVSEASLYMRDFSDSFLDWYMSEKNYEILETVGGYAVEDLGIRLFDRIEGDYFGILGLPLLELLTVLGRRGDIPA
jgi:septum formation protein